VSDAETAREIWRALCDATLDDVGELTPDADLLACPVICAALAEARTAGARAAQRQIVDALLLRAADVPISETTQIKGAWISEFNALVWAADQVSKVALDAAAVAREPQ
jgi:hypothetical protein